MPEFMPYTTEKSPIFQVVETWANGNRQTALQAMWDLLDGTPIADFAPIRSQSLNFPPYATPALRKEHVEKDWWGHRPFQPGEAASPWDPSQPAYNPVPHPPNPNQPNTATGFWRHWYGNAEGVFRETMIRALAISLGVPRESESDTQKYKGKPRPVDKGQHQHWPISIIWKCPCPWYEGWIEFKRFGDQANDGHVTVVLSTPSHGVALYLSPLRPPGSSRRTSDPYGAYAENPVSPAGPEGLWVVSQAAHFLLDEDPASPNPSNSPPPPVPTPAGGLFPPVLGQPVYSAGPVVCVSPAVGDGGAAPGGMPYTP